MICTVVKLEKAAVENLHLQPRILFLEVCEAWRVYEMMRCTSAAWPSVCFRGFVSHALEDIVSFASVTHVDIPACGHVRPPAPAVVVISEKPELVTGVRVFKASRKSAAIASRILGQCNPSSSTLKASLNPRCTQPKV